MWRLLPFVHAMAEGDVTSRLFGIGKGVALRRSAPIYKQMADVFCGHESCGDTVSAGKMALSSSYGARTGEGLDALRYRRFFEKVSKSKTTVQLHNRPMSST